MLLAVLYILEQVGTTDYEVYYFFLFFSEVEQKFLWFAFFFLSFANKVLMVT